MLKPMFFDNPLIRLKIYLNHIDISVIYERMCLFMPNPIDPTFGVNHFKEPEVLSETRTYVNNILMLLFGEPGFYPSIPTIGMNIQKYLYMFSDDINTSEIKAELAHQCSEFLPQVESGNFEVYKTVQNGVNVLIFQLPIIDDTYENSVTLGVTMDGYGNFIYKFIEGKKQII